MEAASNKNNNRGSQKTFKGTKRKFPEFQKAEFVDKKPRTINNLSALDELHELFVDEASFHSSLFRMQVEEMMKEIKLQMQIKDKLANWLNEFRSFLTEIPESESYSINDLTWISDEVRFPIIKLPEETKGMFKFMSPSDVKEIGSFGQNTMCAPEPVIDIALEIPECFWGKQDYLNHRYHLKRALYLTYIAQCLLKTTLVHSMKFAYQHKFYLKPVLLLKPKGLPGSHFSIALYVYTPQNSPFVARCIPSRNNVREYCYSIEKNESVEISTPHYNATIIADLLLPDLNQFLNENISSENVAEGIILLKIWCIQRDLFTGRFRVNGFFIAMFVAYLLKQKKVTSAMTSYQIFRSALLAFSSDDLIQHGITLCDIIKINPSAIEEFHKFYDVVFLDPSGKFNICHSVSKETALMLQHEAKLSIQILNRPMTNNFNLLFMTKIPFCQKFEHIINLQGQKISQACLEKLNLYKKQLDYGEDIIPAIISEICNVLRIGLKTRINLLDVQVLSVDKRLVSKRPRDPNACHLQIGLLLNPAVPPNNMEKGPTTDDPKATEFRSFWGDKSEIRRFKDSTICETVSWPAETIEDKRNALCFMIKHILSRHLGIQEQFVRISGTDMSSILSCPSSFIPLELSPYGTGEEALLRIMDSFDSLSKQLRNLKGLPLIFSSIQGTSPSLRFTETFPPIPKLHTVQKKTCHADGHVLKFISCVSKAPPYVPAMTVILSFEGSGKWPDEVEAIKRMKSVFYIKIASLAHAQFSLTTVAFPEYVDILKDGYIFRLEIVCHKQIILLRQVKLPNGKVALSDTKEYQILNRRTKVLPIMSSLISGVHQMHNSYGTACRLAKRWISSQLLHGYMHDITIELLMAFIYVNPEPYTCPSLPQVAFLRFLYLLHTHDWNANPLIVDLKKELTKSDEEQIITSFSSRRSTYPPMTIVTPLDRGGAMWTRKMPPNIVLNRLVELAKASAEMLQDQLCSMKEIDIKEIFRPPLQPYDAIIKLKNLQIPLRSLAIDYSGPQKVTPKPYTWKSEEKYPIVGYNPVESYLKELRENFDNIAFFFYDAFGGNYIAVAFNPAKFEPSKFMPNHADCCTVVENTEDSELNVNLNLEAILEDFKRLGYGLVKGVELNG